MSNKVKKERSQEETDKLKREFQLGMNSYHVGAVKSAKLDKLNNHIFQGDGDYLIVSNRIGNFIIKVREADRPGLPIEFNGNKIRLKVPKIPKLIYFQIVKFFRHIAKEMSNAEVFAQVYYDLQEEEYTVFIPDQEVAQASVHYDALKNLDVVERDRYVFVFEVHSHNTMGASFSGTDNADEKDTRFFGVIGQINNPAVAEKYRVMVMGKEILLNKEDIFEFEDTEEEAFPEEWATNVKARVHHSGGYQKSYSQGNYNSYYGGQENNDDSYAQYWEDNHYKKNSIDPTDLDLPGSSLLKETGEIVDIYETFDVNNYDDDTRIDIIESFLLNMETKDISVIMENLVEQGFEGAVKEHFRSI